MMIRSHGMPGKSRNPKQPPLGFCCLTLRLLGLSGRGCRGMGYGHCRPNGPVVVAPAAPVVVAPAVVAPAPVPEVLRHSLNTGTPLYAASTNRRCAARPVACRASISLAAIWSKQRTSISPTIGRWNGDKSLSFLPSRALRQSCFSWSIGSHRPRGLGQFTACRSWPS